MNRGRKAPIQPFGQTIRKVLTVIALCGGTLLSQGCGHSGVQPAAQLVAIKIRPTTSLLLLAANRQLQATGIFSDGTQRNLTTEVTWSVSSAPSTSNFITVAPTGMATGVALGTSVVSASMGPVIGLLQLTVNTDGYASSTTAVLPAPSTSTQVDAAYQPISQFVNASGVYSVQVVNLDADLSSSVLPVQTALIASIPMPAGFVPNATAASQSSLKVAVISYSSPQVLVIDASNDPTDPASNTVVGAFTSPVTKTVTFNGVNCVICAAEVNPVTDELVLSTAQGYYTMDLTSGAFMALPATPQLFPAPSFTMNPVFLNQSAALAPYLLSPTYGQDPSTASEVQTLDLDTNTVTDNTGLGVNLPGAVSINVLANQGAVVDTGANGQALLNLSDPHHPGSTPVQNLGVCAAGSGLLDMGALGVGVGLDPALISPTLFLSQRSGNCVGFEIWPSSSTGSQLDPTLIPYGYGSLPPTPDGNPFVNGSDPSAIKTFTSVVNKKNYGLLVDANQNWIAKVDFAAVLNASNQFSGFLLPAGELIPSANLNTGIGGAAVVYLPTIGTVALSTTSVQFGTQAVGSTSVPSTITLTNAGVNPLTISQIAIQGPDASDFAQTNNCPNVVSPKGICTITVTFTPAAQGARSATLSIADDSGNSPQTVALAGTGG